VEISEARVALQKRDVTIWAGDMLEENLRPYNVIHCDNVCIEDPIVEKLEDKLMHEEFTGLYITYKKMLSPALITRSEHVATVNTQASWFMDTPVYYYRVTGASAGTGKR
jgi:hypothetical protein